MPKNSKKNALFLESDREGALIELLDSVMIFVNILRNDENIKRKSPELARVLDLIAKNSDNIKKMLKLAQPIMPDSIKVLANLLNQAIKLLKQFRMDDTFGKSLGVLSTFFPQLKRLKTVSDQKLLTEVQKSVMSLVNDMRDNVSTLLLKARPKDLSDLIALTDACLQFANVCKDKLLNVFKKVEQTINTEEEPAPAKKKKVVSK